MPTRREWQKILRRRESLCKSIEKKLAVAKVGLPILEEEVSQPLSVDYPRGTLKRIGRVAVYAISTKEMVHTKIGISSDIHGRLATIQIGHWEYLYLYYALWMPNQNIAELVEKSINHRLKTENTRGEWFKVSPTEAKKIINEEAARIAGAARLVEHSTMVELLRRMDQDSS